MKKAITVCYLLLSPVLAMAEPAKGLSFSIGVIILLLLNVLTIVGILVMIVSLSVYKLLNTYSSQKRKFFWPTFTLSFVITLIGWQLLMRMYFTGHYSTSSLIILLTIIAVAGAYLGWLATPKRYDEKA